MFIRVALNLVIICCSTILGNQIANGYIHRVRELRTFQMCIAKLETEIIYYSTFLPEALENVGKTTAGGIGQLLCDVASNLKNKKGVNIEAAWQLALDENKTNFKMTYEDYEVISRFCCQLGTADKTTQKQLFELTQLQLYKQEKKAEEDRDRYEKMYRSLGFLAGVTIVIILF